MGEDKAFLEVQGQTLLGRAIDALADADAITVIGGDDERMAKLAVRHQPDRVPGAGPVPAIADALSASTAPHVVILPCDLPYITAEAVGRLVACIGDAQCAAPLVDGRTAWLPSVWSRTATSHVLEAEANGVRSVRRLAQGLRLVHFIDSNPAVWRDADRPDDLPDSSAPSLA